MIIIYYLWVFIKQPNIPKNSIANYNENIDNDWFDYNSYKNEYNNNDNNNNDNSQSFETTINEYLPIIGFILLELLLF